MTLKPFFSVLTPTTERAMYVIARIEKIKRQYAAGYARSKALHVAAGAVKGVSLIT